MELMMKYTKREGSGYQAWCEGIWSWCQVAKENGFDALEWADKWSQNLKGYEGIEDVREKVEDWQKNVTHDFGVGFIMNKIEDEKVKKKFTDKTKRKFYYSDKTRLLKYMPKKDKHLHKPVLSLALVRDYLESCIIWVEKRCSVTHYIREKGSNGSSESWLRTYCVPFSQAKGEFFTVSKDIDEEGNENTVHVRNSLHRYFLEHRDSLCKMYTDVVFKPYYGEKPYDPEREFNTFCGYRAEEIEEEKLDPIVQERLDLVNNHWLETMCNGDKEMFEYVMNWQANLIRNAGREKPKTFLVFVGKQGTGKNMMWEKFFMNGILGAYNGTLHHDLDRFHKSFNSARMENCIHIFNEVSSSTKGKRNADKLKALIDEDFLCELKGKEQFKAKDYAGCVFMSNHRDCVKVENGDRRFVVSEMGDRYAGSGHADYYRSLAQAVHDRDVQNLYFTHLMKRDISDWRYDDIPTTRVRQELQESHNHVLQFLWDVVTEADYEHCQWYCKEMDFFKVEHIQMAYKKYCEFHNIRFQKTRPLREYYFRCKSKDEIPLDNKLVHCRVRSYANRQDGKAADCLKISKDAVRSLTRTHLGKPDWDFPQGATLDAGEISTASTVKCQLR